MILTAQFSEASVHYPVWSAWLVVRGNSWYSSFDVNLTFSEPAPISSFLSLSLLRVSVVNRIPPLFQRVSLPIAGQVLMLPL